MSIIQTPPFSYYIANSLSLCFPSPTLSLTSPLTGVFDAHVPVSFNLLLVTYFCVLLVVLSGMEILNVFTRKFYQINTIKYYILIFLNKFFFLNFEKKTFFYKTNSTKLITEVVSHKLKNIIS